MELPSNDLKENVDNAVIQIVSHPLAITVILQKLLQYFSNTELLTLSFVNKMWNYEARCVIRDRGSLIANLKAHATPDLVDLASDLHGMNVVPFSGMRMTLVSPHPPTKLFQDPPFLDPLARPCPEKMAFIYNIIFNRIPLFKYFHIIDEAGFQKFNENKPRFLFARQVLQDFSEVLEEIEMTCRSSPGGSCLQDVVQSSSFPNLKILSFNGPSGYCPRSAELVKVMVSNAPNLQELHAEWSHDILKNALNGSSAMFVPRQDIEYFRFMRLPESAIRRIKLKSLFLKEIGNYGVRGFNRIIPLLLQASCMSLKSLTIDSALAVPIMCYGVTLEKVTELKMYMNCRELELFQSGVSSLLRTCDFTRIFPNLHEVRVKSRCSVLKLDDIREFVRLAQTVLRKPTPDRAANIKHLSLSYCFYGHTAGFLAEIFPDIERLSIKVDDEQEIPCSLIWKHWANLKEIKVRKTAWMRDVPRIANLDSVFCGIFPEEVDELRGKDDEYLKCVNIVPVMPSITCLKKLREITLSFKWFVLGRPNEELVDAFRDSEDPTFVFSKVTCLTAFARCPDLLVTIKTNCALMNKALSHMKPYLLSSLLAEGAVLNESY